jgi:hypothetical protein
MDISLGGEASNMNQLYHAPLVLDPQMGWLSFDGYKENS